MGLRHPVLSFLFVVGIPSYVCHICDASHSFVWCVEWVSQFVHTVCRDSLCVAGLSHICAFTCARTWGMTYFHAQILGANRIHACDTTHSHIRIYILALNGVDFSDMYMGMSHVISRYAVDMNHSHTQILAVGGLDTFASLSKMCVCNESCHSSECTDMT